MTPAPFPTPTPSRPRSAPPLFRPWGIRTRFIAAVVLFAVALSASFTFLTIRQIRHTLHDHMRDRGNMMLQRLAKDVVDAEALDDALEREIRLLVLTNRTVLDDALYVQVVLDGEQVVASAEDGWLPSVASVQAEESSVGEHRHEGTSFYDFFSPLPPGASGPSYVRFGLSLAPVQARVDALLGRTIWIGLLFCTIGTVVATWLYRRVFDPLNRLLHSVRRLAAGDDEARARILSGDELQELAGEFNRMADAIAARTEQLQRANTDLARADAAKADFLATMSHEWKTPLHAVRGYAQLLLEEVDGPLNEAQRDDVEAVLASANHLLALIENVLHFIQSEHDEGPNHPEPLDLAVLARQAWDHVRPAARARQLTLRDELPHSLPIEGDRTRLRQALINVIGNAVQYTPTGSITLQGGYGANGKADGGAEDALGATADGPNATVWLRVIDTGVGIPVDAQSAIFEPFERIAQIPEDWKGEHNVTTIRVLIAEDDPASAALLDKYLRAKGYATALAKDGSEVMTQMMRHAPDIILLDVEMPERDGWEALAEIRAVSEVPVIMVTVRSSTSDKVRGLEEGADDYVTKPFDLKEIEARIRAVLRGRARVHENAASPLRVGPLTVDDRSKEVVLHGESLHVSPKEYALLHLLCSEPETVFETDDICRAVWPERHDATAEDVKTYVYLLRTKLNEAAARTSRSAPRIQNVRGFGYCIRPE